MATVNITAFSLTQDVGNGTFTMSYDIVFDEFDKNTNIGYFEAWRFFEDDTGFDNDLDAPDDAIGFSLTLLTPLRADGRDSVSRTRTKTVAWVDLNLDSDTWGGDEEFRGEVTLTPQLPAVVKRQSNVVLERI